MLAVRSLLSRWQDQVCISQGSVASSQEQEIAIALESNVGDTISTAPDQPLFHTLL